MIYVSPSGLYICFEDENVQEKNFQLRTNFVFVSCYSILLSALRGWSWWNCACMSAHTQFLHEYTSSAYIHRSSFAGCCSQINVDPVLLVCLGLCFFPSSKQPATEAHLNWFLVRLRFRALRNYNVQLAHVPPGSAKTIMRGETSTPSTRISLVKKYSGNRLDWEASKDYPRCSRRPVCGL